MSRNARIKSESGFYHVMIRGIGRQLLFEDDNDYDRFLETMKRYLNEHAIEIHAYCLMENHVHLLMRDLQNELDLFMKRLEGSYAYYFNHKYERVGTLFQDRFRSEVIESDAYFADVLRYILQNPQNAHICATDAYRWSSYAETVNGGGIVQTDYAVEFFGGKEKLLAYVLEPGKDNCLDLNPVPVSDNHAREIIRKQLHIENGIQLQSYGKKERDDALRVLKKHGMSVRQIERLTGINRGIVLKA